MLSTKQLLDRIAAANPDDAPSEEQLRRAIRIGDVAPPSTVAGRFVWGEEDVALVARAMGLQVPMCGADAEVRP